MKIEDTKFIFLAFKRVLNYSEDKVLNTLKEWIKTNLNAKKITKKVFVYDVKSIILRFNL